MQEADCSLTQTFIYEEKFLRMSFSSFLIRTEPHAKRCLRLIYRRGILNPTHGRFQSFVTELLFALPLLFTLHAFVAELPDHQHKRKKHSKKFFSLSFLLSFCYFINFVFFRAAVSSFTSSLHVSAIWHNLEIFILDT